MVQITPLLQALAIASQAYPAARDVSPRALAVRQVDTSDLPSQCQSSCQVINTITDCGSTLSCICVSSVGTDLQSCMNCLVAAEPSVETDAQSAIDNWNVACGGSLTLTDGSSTITASGSASTQSSSASTKSSSTSTKTTSTSSTSSSNPLVGNGGVVGINAATGAIGLAIAIACGILVL
ncbi:hypothetical protein DFH29DRAFT_959327 [Suillus ampliporus]|nr:hypothetical protein DFH29DRAFT_959327 [Suillus ampliporus]